MGSGVRYPLRQALFGIAENPKAIQEFMGHATIQMTFDRYGHLMPGSRDEARRRLDAYLSGPGAERVEVREDQTVER